MPRSHARASSAALPTLSTRTPGGGVSATFAAISVIYGAILTIRQKDLKRLVRARMEKTGEELTYLQGPTNVTRMDYASPLANELVFAMAAEKLLGVLGRLVDAGNSVIVIEHDLDVMRPGQTLAESASRILAALDPERPATFSRATDGSNKPAIRP